MPRACFVILIAVVLHLSAAAQTFPGLIGVEITDRALPADAWLGGDNPLRPAACEVPLEYIILLRRHGLGFRHRESGVERSLRPDRSAALDALVLAQSTSSAGKVTLASNAVSLALVMHWRTGQAGD